jgi:chromosome segregation ATPase
MRKLSCSLGIALLVTWCSLTLADEPSATAPAATGYVQPPTAPALLPAPLPAEPLTAAPSTGAQPKPGDKAQVRAVEAAEPGKAPVPSVVPQDDPTVLRLKARLKTANMSLAETSGRLAVTEKDLAAANADNSRLRTENTTLNTNLAKAETSGKKAEEEVTARRQEVRSLTDRLATLKTASSGSSTAVVFALTVALILAAVVFGQGSKIRRLLARLPDGKADDKRLEQLRAQLKDEQQKATRLDEECQRLREASNRATASVGGSGSKKDKIEQARRELRETKAAAEAQKRSADERIAALEAAQATLDADRRADDEKITALEAEVARLSKANQKLEAALAKANEKLTFLGHEDDTLEISHTPSPV